MFKITLLGFLFVVSHVEAFQKIKIENYGQVKATISKDEMNRISVEGDRITQLFGIEDKFETELDEVNGQVFIKPLTIGKDPLSITIVTEEGITQDLILTPKKGPSEVILLQSKEGLKNQESIETSFYFKSLPIQQKVLKLFKQLAGEGRIRGFVKEENFDRFKYERTSKSPNLRVRPITVFKGREFTGIVAELVSTTCLPYLASPKEIYEEGDMAISFPQQILEPNSPVRIYILRKTGRE
tara:strand:- start:14630 stop:15352 length:723 start_codon:yes stop_codon:yes gene_type:complete